MTVTESVVKEEEKVSEHLQSRILEIIGPSFFQT